MSTERKIILASYSTSSSLFCRDPVDVNSCEEISLSFFNPQITSFKNDVIAFTTNIGFKKERFHIIHTRSKRVYACKELNNLISFIKGPVECFACNSQYVALSSGANVWVFEVTEKGEIVTESIYWTHKAPCTRYDKLISLEMFGDYLCCKTQYQTQIVDMKQRVLVKSLLLGCEAICIVGDTAYYSVESPGGLHKLNLLDGSSVETRLRGRISQLLNYKNKFVVGAMFHEVRLYDAVTLKEHWITLQGHYYNINHMSLDGDVLATAAKDKTIRLWDLKFGDTLRTIRAPESAHSGATLALFCTEKLPRLEQFFAILKRQAQSAMTTSDIRIKCF